MLWLSLWNFKRLTYLKYAHEIGGFNIFWPSTLPAMPTKKMCIPCLSYCTNGHKIHNLSDQWYHVFPVDVGFLQQTMSNYQRASLILKCLRPQWVGSTSGWTRLGALQFTRDRDVYIHVELCRLHIQYFHLRPWSVLCISMRLYRVIIFQMSYSHDSHIFPW